jgi:hypothetical protein
VGGLYCDYSAEARIYGRTPQTYEFRDTRFSFPQFAQLHKVHCEMKIARALQLHRLATRPYLSTDFLNPHSHFGLQPTQPVFPPSMNSRASASAA